MAMCGMFTPIAVPIPRLPRAEPPVIRLMELGWMSEAWGTAAC